MRIVEDEDQRTVMSEDQAKTFFRVNHSHIERREIEARSRSKSRREPKTPAPVENVDLPSPTKLVNSRNRLYDQALGKDATKQLEDLKHKKLFRSMFILPVILATEMHLPEDKAFVQGCQLLMQHRYTKAVEMFRSMDQDVTEEKLSTSEQTMSRACSDSTQSITTDSVRIEEQQDCLSSLDSGLKRHRLGLADFDLHVQPWQLLPSSRRGSITETRRRPSVMKVKSDVNLFTFSRRQICYFNLAVCFAKCGYMKRAKATLSQVV